MATAYKSQKIPLEDGVDVGYEVEKIELNLTAGTKFTTPTRGVTTLLVCTPFLDDATLMELRELDSEFASKNVENFEAIFVLSNGQKAPDEFGFIQFASDGDDEFGPEFGVKIISGELIDMFAKAIFVISRDHILYYKEICKNVEDRWNQERLFMQLGKALNVYTGTGCH